MGNYRALLLGLSLGSTVAFGADTALSLNQALLEAESHNPHLQRLRAAANEASWLPLEALSGNLPKLSFTVSHLFDVKYQTLDLNFGGTPTSFPLIYPKTQYSLGVTWTVFDGLKTPFLHSAASDREEAAALDLDSGHLKLQQDIRLKFYRALAAEKLSSVAEMNVKTLEDHFHKVQIRLKGGSATQFDILRIKVQLEEALPEKLAVQDGVALSRKELARAMGLESDARPIQGELPTPSEAALPKTTADLTIERADIKALQQRAKAAQTMHSVSYAGFLPRVNLTAEKNFYNNVDYSMSTSLKDAYALGVMLSWDLFDGGASFARTKQSVYQAQQAELLAREATLKAPLELEEWRRKFLYNVSLYNARSRAIEMAEESVRLAKLGMDAGVRTNSDVLDSELDLFRARAGLVRAQLDASEALINLELALGRKISNG